MKSMLLSFGRACLLGAVVIAVAPLAVSAQEKKEDSKLSERTVRVIMGMAFAAIPDQLPKPDGKMVKIDRSDPKKFMIPMDDAREIIVRSVLAGRAELCGLSELKAEHFKRMMKRERARDKWSSYQMIYIDHLAATTETFLTGQQAVGDDAKKKLDPKDDAKNKYKCSDEQRAKVKAQLEDDIKQLAQASQ